MAYKLTEIKPCYAMKDAQKTYVCDTEEDVGNLPKCAAGSMAMIADTGKIYMVNASGEWVNFGG